MLNALTIDLEDWYHPELVRHRLPVSYPGDINTPPCPYRSESLGDWEPQIEQATQQLLDLLEAQHIQATFFVVGQIAQCHPQLIERTRAWLLAQRRPDGSWPNESGMLDDGLAGSVNRVGQMDLAATAYIGWAVFGSQGATTFLSKVTTAAAVLFMLTSLSLAYFASRRTTSVMKDTPVSSEAPPVQEAAPAPQAPPADLPTEPVPGAPALPEVPADQ